MDVALTLAQLLKSSGVWEIITITALGGILWYGYRKVSLLVEQHNTSIDWMEQLHKAIVVKDPEHPGTIVTRRVILDNQIRILTKLESVERLVQASCNPATCTFHQDYLEVFEEHRQFTKESIERFCRILDQHSEDRQAAVAQIDSNIAIFTTEARTARENTQHSIQEIARNVERTSDALLGIVRTLLERSVANGKGPNSNNPR